MLALELHTRDIPAIYKRFSREIGERSWIKRVSLMKEEIKGNPLLESYHYQDSAIAFQLVHLCELQQRFGGFAAMAYNDHHLYQAASFAIQVPSVIDASSPVFVDRFRARVRDCIGSNPADLRALELELRTATHFLRAGRKVTWPEMSCQDV